MNPGLLAEGRFWNGFSEARKDEPLKNVNEAAKEDDLLGLLDDITEFCLYEGSIESWMVQTGGADDLYFVWGMIQVARGIIDPRPLTPWRELFVNLRRPRRLVKEALTKARTSKASISGSLFMIFISEIQGATAFAA